tara:strand:- start:1009 stop:1512 length:504 start_codon:yes stop_codon:yes gene_type:complete
VGRSYERAFNRLIALTHKSALNTAVLRSLNAQRAPARRGQSYLLRGKKRGQTPQKGSLSVNSSERHPIFLSSLPKNPPNRAKMVSTALATLGLIGLEGKGAVRMEHRAAKMDAGENALERSDPRIFEFVGTTKITTVTVRSMNVMSVIGALMDAPANKDSPATSRCV